MSQVPQVARAVPIVAAADRVPVSRRVHALSAVVGGVPQILRPEEWLIRLVDEHRVMGYCSAIVIQVVRTLGIGVVCCAVNRQVSMMKNRELVLVQVLVFRKIGTGGEFNPCR